MNIFDTHAHLLDEQFDADREELLVSLPAQGITHVMEACCDEAGIDRVVALVARTPYFYGSAGVHPHSASEFTPATLDHIREALMHERMVAIGEIGLDYHYDFSPREQQRDCFDAQLALSAELKAPIIIHDREAHGDCFAIVCEYPSLRGVFHCYSGSAEMARELLDLGWMLSFNGAITFKNARKLKEVVAMMPADRILLETDSPYLSPTPYRGKRNNSTRLPLVLEEMAALRGCTRLEMEHQTWDNACRFYRMEA